MEKRKEEREPFDSTIDFIVLLTQTSDLKRLNSTGRIINFSRSGIGIETDFPLEPGHVVEWDDMHKKGKLHIALVKWSQRIDKLYRAGLMFI